MRGTNRQRRSLTIGAGRCNSEESAGAVVRGSRRETHATAARGKGPGPAPYQRVTAASVSLFRGDGRAEHDGLLILQPPCSPRSKAKLPLLLLDTLNADELCSCSGILYHTPLTPRAQFSSVLREPVSSGRWVRAMMKPLQSNLLLTAVFMACCCVAQAGDLSPPQSEASLEPEFQQLRAKLMAMPEFSGADANSQFLLAQELAHRGDMQGAAETYRAAIHLKPDWPDPYRGLGQVLLDHHDYADAADALQSSIRLGRDDHQVFYWLGRAHMGTGALAAAAVALEQATKLNEDDAEAFADIGLVKMAQGDVAEAEKALAKSIKLKPDYAEAHRFREVLTKNQHEQQRVMQEALVILQGLFARE